MKTIMLFLWSLTLPCWFVLQSHPAFSEYHDLLEGLEERLSSVADSQEKWGRVWVSNQVSGSLTRCLIKKRSMADRLLSLTFQSYHVAVDEHLYSYLTKRWEYVHMMLRMAVSSYYWSRISLKSQNLYCRYERLELLRELVPLHFFTCV
jgi:hypothetical protein